MNSSTTKPAPAKKQENVPPSVQKAALNNQIANAKVTLSVFVNAQLVQL
jgi:hypothetical protein